MSKKRPISHITGDKAIEIIKAILPKEWVIRTITPDYGIDLLIELFDFVDASNEVSETLGEFLFVQVKGTTRLERKNIRIHPVYNVAKAKWKENEKEYMEVEVVNYSIDTSLLDTVRRVGTSVCVMLFVVDVDENVIFSICLNDLIDKYLQPKNPQYRTQRTVTIPIPTDNKIDGSFESLVPLRLYAKRSKLYSAFTIIRYQLKEIKREISQPDISFLDENADKDQLLEHVTRQLSELVLFFADQLLQLDIWQISDHLLALDMCKINLNAVVTVIKNGKVNDYHTLIAGTMQVWQQLDNLSSIYEEICREWFLPKFIGQLGSYPDSPEVKTVT